MMFRRMVRESRMVSATRISGTGMPPRGAAAFNQSTPHRDTAASEISIEIIGAE